MCYKQERQDQLKENLNEKLKEAPSFVSDYFYNGKSAATNNIYWSYIRDLLQWLIDKEYILEKRIKDITPNDLNEIRQANIERYLTELKEGNGCKKNSQDSLSTKKNIFSAFWGWLKKNRYVDENIVYELEYKKKKKKNSGIKVPSQKQMENFLYNIEHCGNDFLRIRNKAIVLLFNDSGIRSEELLTLDKCDIIFDERRPYVIVLGKGYYDEEDKERVYISPLARDAVRNYLDYRKENCKNDNSEALFISERGNRLSKTSMKSFFKKYSNGEINPHMLRHYCGSKLYKKTNDIMLAKEHLRHSSVKITEQHYVHIEEDDLARAVCGV